jgi:hypothetical protein
MAGMDPRPDTFASADKDVADLGRVLHTRLLAGDPTAPAELVELHLDPLVLHLRRRYSTTDDHLLQTVAIDLLLDLAERPAQFNPHRADLAAYLRMAARRDVQNALRSEARRAAHHAPVEAVELAQLAGNPSREGLMDPADMPLDEPTPDDALDALLRASFNPHERPLVEAMLDGERRTATFAALLGIQDRPPAEQAQEVKRVKDRLKKRLRRLAPRTRGARHA